MENGNSRIRGKGGFRWEDPSASSSCSLSRLHCCRHNPRQAYRRRGLSM